ncbi:hypothetical protein DFA_01410 [Cavenderia fasciculata]|uniref:3',5'-cyclic-nucleotide phosphodiesterase n=1 Tax=Cavenderia fasciculata TaxID=261658 RepID=F4PSJ4_CACFS|nr:uncharacterized protein DFA_01410 [Cavenderia fasciculata]EGG21524.1 hypothetical protein DFA_01410 [Cavenderia fasciculata]|eukprot:XP_004359374.1 hypothetical protein DFA_01410 [Cavenderia fasciculata]
MYIKSLFLLAIVVFSGIVIPALGDAEGLDFDFFGGGPSSYDSYSLSRSCRNKNFITLPLGTAGGLDESNLSAFLLARKDNNVFVALDAGNIWSGISKYISARNLASIFDIQYPAYAKTTDQKAAWFLRNHIAGYMAGHSHLDHLEGLIENSAEDALSYTHLNYGITDGILSMIQPYLAPNTTAGVLRRKPILGLNSTLQAIDIHLFNNIIWPDLALYGRYSYNVLTNASTQNFAAASGWNVNANIAGTIFANMDVSTFETCHNDIFSTAFLFTDQITGEQFVFFSDTGIPSGTYNCDWKQRIHNVWAQVKIDKLRAVYLEVSFPNSTPDASMFGHVRPKDVLALLDDLVDLSVQTTPFTESLSHVKLIVQHIKPYANAATFTIPVSKVIENELKAGNTHNIQVVIPEQGVPICF